MLIARVKIDSRGRVSLPRTFIDANGLNESTHIVMKNKPGCKDELVLKFITLHEDNSTRNTETPTEA